MTDTGNPGDEAMTDPTAREIEAVASVLRTIHLRCDDMCACVGDNLRWECLTGDPPETFALAAILAHRSVLAEMGMRDNPYFIQKPAGGWRDFRSFTESEKAMLRPIAETLAMLDSNAFFEMPGPAGYEHYECYLPEAHALFESNGGLNGWAGGASFAVGYRAMIAATEPKP